MTASPSLHLSAGMDLRHCLESKKRPGKNTDPAARMVNMVPEGLSEGYKVQQAIQSQSPATLSSLKYKKKKQLTLASCRATYLAVFS